MSSHRDFTPDEDPDELLLSASRPEEPAPPQVTSIRLKIGSGSGNGGKPLVDEERVKHEDGDQDMDMQPTSSMVDAKPDLAKPLPNLDVAKPATGSRKRVLSNPLDPPSSASTTTSRKRPKVTQRKPKRKPALPLVDPASLPSPGMYTADGDDLLADELSLMDEDLAKKSTRGSSPQYPLDFAQTPDAAQTRVSPLPSERLTRMTPESSPEITLLEDNVPQQRAILVPIPGPAPSPAVGHMRKKKKAWLTQKTVPVAIAPNPGTNNNNAGASTDPYTQTPPPGATEKRKATRKSRAARKSAAMVSSPQLDPVPDPDSYAGEGMYLDRSEYAGEVGEGGSDSMDVKPRKKKSRKLKPGEVGPGKHW